MRFLLLFVSLVSASGLCAQSTVKGSVVTADGEPAVYATVSLYDSATNEVIKAVSTDLAGSFELTTEVSAFGLSVSYLGFAERRILDLTPSNGLIDLGRIELHKDTKLLDEVVVKGEKSSVEFKLDKRVFNVGKDLNARGGNALNVLENVPSVQVDVEGNVSLRGTENVRILINGRPNGLVGDNGKGLRALTADLIDKIEVITNPSARYEAEGTGGVINIVLKKKRSQGLNGSFNVIAGLPESYGGAVNLNYRSGNLNWFTNYGLNYRNRIGQRGVVQDLFIVEGVKRSDQTGRLDRSGLNHNFRLGVDY
ncbi:MAG: TonB-dependent receptor plug domain-containing protein, partial [Bacteroidota bacterium]